MFIQDWLALFLASLVVAFAVFAEIRDGMLMENCFARHIESDEKSAAAGGLLSTA